jgi:hypothetical protein
MIISFYDSLKSTNPKALYLLHLYIQLQLRITSNSTKSIVTLDFDNIDAKEHFSVMKMIKNPSKEFLATCFKGFFFSKKLQNEKNVIDFFPTEVLLIILYGYPTELQCFYLNTSYNSSFAIRTKNSSEVNSSLKCIEFLLI